MIFAAFPIHETENAVLAHSVMAGSRAFKKGHIVTASDIELLRDAGIERIYVAKLEPGDVSENEAAAALNQALGGHHTRCADAFTGRANLHANADGLVLINAAMINAINKLDEGLTIATLAPYETVTTSQMLATVKIIPFAVRRSTLAKAIALAKTPAVEVAPFKLKQADLILTDLAGSKPSLLKKAERVIAARIADFNMELCGVQVCDHTEAAVERALAHAPDTSQLTLVLGASATVDRADIVPAAIMAAGGTLHHFGMPVDPGNLLLTAELRGRHVLGLPGCARSPKLNGADWVIARLAAGIMVRSEDIQNMGVGGLLKEIPSRPQPRNKNTKAMKTKPRRIAAIILAAGRSTRMGEENKLTAEVGLKPMIAHVTDAALSAHIDEIILVTGHEEEKVLKALGGRPLTHTHNPDYAEGLSTSIKAGIKAAITCSPPVDAALILLGDMPLINADIINQLIEAHAPDDDRLIIVPSVKGKRGNPVLWDASFFPELQALSGDMGAKHLIAENVGLVVEVEIESEAPLIDIDTKDALATVSPNLQKD
ncbi:MAG: molybdopterin-binding/glycosyltransferase family 2 protein [Parvibaculum sp.]